MDYEDRPHNPKTYQFPRPHDTWGGNKPKRKNISHTVLKLTGNRTVELMPSDIKPVSTGSRTHICYNLQGIRVISPRKGVYIQDGKKWVVK